MLVFGCRYMSASLLIIIGRIVDNYGQYCRHISATKSKSRFTGSMPVFFLNVWVNFWMDFCKKE
ncbi:hypothetical protein M2465_000097 [Parabacteroides sp. PH5-17]|nr:hypothetical protein [Parabacteroides sp. PH5-39]MDH6321961.1 hypothetical protein [Parabacteroides sp. PH5-8]MDH6382946.1 hypothetical protein [Parabacteroides sp. PH5-17]MDH6392452.1 hypothetical protein [Parabacteroides sp. PFB2-22]